MKQIYITLGFGCVSFFVGALYTFEFYNIQTSEVIKHKQKIIKLNPDKPKILSIEFVRNYTQFQLNKNSESRNIYIIDKPSSVFMESFVNQEFSLHAKVNFIPYYNPNIDESNIQHIYCLNNNPGLTMYNYTLGQPLPELKKCDISKVSKLNKDLHAIDIERFLPIVVFDSGDIVYNATQSNQMLINKVFELTKPKYVDFSNYNKLMKVAESTQKTKQKPIILLNLSLKNGIKKNTDNTEYSIKIESNSIKFTKIPLSKYLLNSTYAINNNYNLSSNIIQNNCYQQKTINDLMVSWLPILPSVITIADDNLGAVPPLLGTNKSHKLSTTSRKFKFIKSEKVSDGSLTIITHEPPKVIKVDLPKFARVPPGGL